MSSLVLVIEDDPDQRRFLERMLGTSGYRVVSAADGEAGLAAAASAHPDVIVLDVMMPRMNGYQVCRALKQEPATAGVPVVFLTTKDQPADEFWATEVGADAFLTKPVEFQTLLDEITRVMGSK